MVAVSVRTVRYEYGTQVKLEHAPISSSVERKTNELLPIECAQCSLQVRSRQIATYALTLLKDLPVAPPNQESPIAVNVNMSASEELANPPRRVRVRCVRFVNLQVWFAKLEIDGRANGILQPPARLPVDLSVNAFEDWIDSHVADYRLFSPKSKKAAKTRGLQNKTAVRDRRYRKQIVSL
jgi:hypothetical protein